MNLVNKNAAPVQRLRSKGLTYQTIADKLKLSLSTAYRAANTVKPVKPAAVSFGIDNTATSERIYVAANHLRDRGWIYADIAAKLDIPVGTAWRLCNRPRARELASCSTARYNARGKVAIVDIRPRRLWLAMNRVVA